MSKLIILRGNSGSGKTTIAKEIQKNFGRNTMLISQDVIRRDMLRVKDGENTEAISLMKEWEAPEVRRKKDTMRFRRKVLVLVKAGTRRISFFPEMT